MQGTARLWKEREVIFSQFAGAWFSWLERLPAGGREFESRRCPLALDLSSVALTVGFGSTFWLELLETGRVVACFCVDAERRKSLGGAQFDLDLSPPSVV